MLDVMSGGRMEFAFPLGTGMEYWANAGAINPATARARFRESLEVIMKAWTQDGPIRYDGDFYTYRYLNPWPAAVPEAAPEVLHRRLGEQGDRAARGRLRHGLLDRLRADREPAARVRPDARAGSRASGPDGRPGRPHHRRHGLRRRHRRGGRLREARPHIETFFSWFHRVPPKYLVPPGYVSTEEFLRRSRTPPWPRAPRRPGTTWSRSDASRAAHPTPSPTRSSSGAEEAGCARVNVVLEHGDMPEWKTVEEHDLFANEVIPRIRAGGEVAVGGRARRGGGGELRCRSTARSTSTSTASTRRSSRAGRGRPARLLPRRRNRHGLRGAAAARGALPADRPASPRVRRLGRRHEHRQHPGLRPALPRPLRPARHRRGFAGRPLDGRLHGGWFAIYEGPASSGSCSRAVGPARPRAPHGRHLQHPRRESCLAASRRTCRSSRGKVPMPPPPSSWPSATGSRRRRRACCGTDLRPQAAEVAAPPDVPTLLLWGDADRIIPVGRRRRPGRSPAERRGEDPPWASAICCSTSLARRRTPSPSSGLRRRRAGEEGVTAGGERRIGITSLRRTAAS